MLLVGTFTLWSNPRSFRIEHILARGILYIRTSALVCDPSQESSFYLRAHSLVQLSEREYRNLVQMFNRFVWFRFKVKRKFVPNLVKILARIRVMSYRSDFGFLMIDSILTKSCRNQTAWIYAWKQLLFVKIANRETFKRLWPTMF